MNDCRCARSRVCFSIDACGQHHALRALRLEARVVAGVAPQLLLVDVHDDFTTPSRKSRSCEMTSSVPGVALQPVLEPDDGVEVEVVGRLVEQQQVGGHISACARFRRMRQPPEKLATGCSSCSCESPGRAAALGARAHGVGIGIAERRVQLADAHAVVGASACELGLERSAASRRRRSRTRAPAGRAPASPARRARRASARGKSTSPSSACSSPRSSANRLDLPEPLAPIRPILSPGLSARSASRAGPWCRGGG